MFGKTLFVSKHCNNECLNKFKYLNTVKIVNNASRYFFLYLPIDHQSLKFMRDKLFDRLIVVTKENYVHVINL
jgi:hypothetical protein